MIYQLLIISFLVLFSSVGPDALAQECTHLWQASNVSTEDTRATSRLLQFYDKPGLRLEMRGQFHRGRFMSFETYRGAQKLRVAALFDFEMEADPGSLNPFQKGVDMDTPDREYRVSVLPEGVMAPTSNVVLLARSARVHSVVYRTYAPSEGSVPSSQDLPRIFAFDSLTGEPMECPNSLEEAAVEAEASAFALAKWERILDFEERNAGDETTAAIPTYVRAVSRVPTDSVTLVRFRAPTFVDTTSGKGPFLPSQEVRYWSFCVRSLREPQALACVPDYLAKLDDGVVTIAVGRGEEVRRVAEGQGYTFLEDRREASQEAIGYFYQNLLPHANFTPYQDDYLPTGVVCSREEFLEGRCE